MIMEGKQEPKLLKNIINKRLSEEFDSRTTKKSSQQTASKVGLHQLVQPKPPHSTPACGHRSVLPASLKLLVFPVYTTKSKRLASSRTKEAQRNHHMYNLNPSIA
jgi:hypothetical protein